MTENPDNRSAPAIAPPPLPAQPIGYATPLPPPAETTNAARQMARASWMAPIVAILFSFMSNLSGGPGGGWVTTSLILLIILLGFTFGIIALFRMKRHGPRGILAPAIVGLCLNGLILAANGIFLVRSQLSWSTMSAPVAATSATGSNPVSAATPAGTAAPNVSSPERSPPAASAVESRAAVTEFPGWLGIADRIDLGARIVVLHWSDDAPATQKMKSGFASDFTMLSLIVNNTQGKQQLTIDPASLEFHLADYTTVKAIPPKEIVATARSDGDGYLKKWGGDIIVPPGGSAPDGVAFLPPKTDLSTARAVTMTLNGQQIIVPGKYCTAAEKRQVIDAMNGR